MTRPPHLRHRGITLSSRSIPLVISLAVLGAPPGFAAPAASDPAAACVSLASLTNFPVTPTQITSAQFNPSGTVSANGVPLPGHCQVDGIINQRTGSDGYPYGDAFEVRLPIPADWNGRFMFQGGGGTEGSIHLPLEPREHYPRRSLMVGPWRARTEGMKTANCRSRTSFSSIRRRSLTTPTVRST